MLDHMAVDVERRRFSADEYQRMGDAGIFSDTDRVELIDGEILTMSPIGPRHCAVVDRVTRIMVLAAGTSAIVRIQGSIRLNGFTQPEPDVVLLRPRDDFYRAGHPQPADILLVLEIAEASLRYDRDVKAALYARAGIVEYWLADQVNGVVICHTEPRHGVYREVTTYERGQSLSPRGLSDCTVAVDDLLMD
jgi:Uma2 family endonuclease